MPNERDFTEKRTFDRRKGERRKREGRIRRIVTVELDIPGFTKEGNRLVSEDPAHAAERLGENVKRRHYPIIKHAENFGGSWDTWGDSLIIFYGTKESHEDEPRRALLALDYAYRELEAQGQELPRAGVSWGDAYVFQKGNSDKVTAIGDSVTRAQRMEHSLKEVLKEAELKRPIAVDLPISDHPTYRSMFMFSLGEPYRGRKNPEEKEVEFRIFESVNTEIFERRLSETPFIGRHKDLDDLEKLLEEEPVVHLIEDGGMGKSRLLKELESRGKYSIFKINFDPFDKERQEDLSAFKRFLKSNKPSNEQLEKIKESLPHLSGMLGDTTSGYRAPKEKRFKALADLLSVYSAEEDKQGKDDMGHKKSDKDSCQPVLFEIEDLHYADEESMEFVEFFSEYLTVKKETDKIHRVVLTARPEIKRMLPGSRLSLKPLGKNDSKRFLQSIIGKNLFKKIDRSEIERVVRECEGSPFDLEQEARSYASTFQWGKKETADRVIGRKSRLTKDERILIEYIATKASYSMDFDVREILGAAKIDTNAVDCLVDDGWIIPVKDNIYQLKHHRFLESIYGSESKGVSGEMEAGLKKSLHRELAESIESGILKNVATSSDVPITIDQLKVLLFCPHDSEERMRLEGGRADLSKNLMRKYFSEVKPRLEELAYHWEMAGELGKAIGYLKRKQKQYASPNPFDGLRFAEKTALVRGRQLKEVSGNPNSSKDELGFLRQAKISDKLAIANIKSYRTNQYAEASLILEDVDSEMSDYGTTLENRATYYIVKSRLCRVGKKWPETLQALTKARALASESRSKKLEATVNFVSGTLEMEIGNENREDKKQLKSFYTEAVKHLEKSLRMSEDILEECHDYEEENEILVGIVGAAAANLGSVYVGLGEFESGRMYLQRALEIKQEAGDIAEACTIRNNIGHSYMMSGNFEEAEKQLISVIGDAKKFYAAEQLIAAYITLGELNALMKDMNSAVVYMGLAEKTAVEYGNPSGLLETVESVRRGFQKPD